jgi:hypothetical protein
MAFILRASSTRVWDAQSKKHVRSLRRLAFLRRVNECNRLVSTVTQFHLPADRFGRAFLAPWR